MIINIQRRLGTILILLKLIKLLLRLVYSILKLLPTRNKVVFLSRQTNEPSIDYRLIAQELRIQSPKVEIVMLCKRIEKSPKDLSEFGIILIKSLYHLATSKVCILDTYWPAVSLLSHKKSLKIIQIWHAMGKIKQSGYKTVNREGGRGKKFSEAMDMHKNYDLIVAGAEAWNPYYCESFNVSEDILLNVGLPRIDYLIHDREKIVASILKVYPNLNQKPIILYAPTFRRTGNEGWDKLLHEINLDTYNLIIKSHPNQPLHYTSSAVYEVKEFTALECLAISDYLITDYSAIAVEAAAISVKTYYYLYDYEKYRTKNGLNIDLFNEMPGCVFENAHELMETLNKGSYNESALASYQVKYLPIPLGESTKQIVATIKSYL